MKQFFQWMNQDENIRSAGEAFLKPGCHSIYGLSGSVKSALVAKVLHEGPRQVVLVVPSREQAAAWQADLAFLAPDVKVLDFPVVDKAVFTTTAKSLDRMARQMEALGRLRQGDPVLVLAAPEEAAQYVMAPQRIDDAAIDVEIQGEYDRDDLLQNLVDAGYERVDMVERRGHFPSAATLSTSLPSMNRSPCAWPSLAMNWKASAPSTSTAKSRCMMPNGRGFCPCP